MFIPLYTDRRLKRTPVINITLIFINMAVFVAQIQSMPPPGVETDAPMWWEPYMLHRGGFQWYQLITHMFLHGDFMHLAGNMLFLWIFGNSVEDRLRPWGYISFYLLGGAAAGTGHLLTSMYPAIGASGAVAAVTGAFLAMFPQSRITIFIWLFFFIWFLPISGMYVILFYIAMDIFGAMTNPHAGVAFIAHLAGYLYGFVIGMGLLLTGLLEREQFDMLSMARQWNRRRQFRAMSRDDASPWARDASKRMGGDSGEVPPDVAEARSAVRSAVNDGDGAAAADAYERLLRLDDKQVMSVNVQHTLGNLAMQAERHVTAARAYRAFLDTYPNHADAPDVAMLLGRLYQRHLDNPDHARELLTAARDRHRNPDRRALAEQWLAELDAD